MAKKPTDEENYLENSGLVDYLGRPYSDHITILEGKEKTYIGLSILFLIIALAFSAMYSFGCHYSLVWESKIGKEFFDSFSKERQEKIFYFYIYSKISLFLVFIIISLYFLRLYSKIKDIKILYREKDIMFRTLEYINDNNREYGKEFVKFAYQNALSSLFENSFRILGRKKNMEKDIIEAIKLGKNKEDKD